MKQEGICPIWLENLELYLNSQKEDRETILLKWKQKIVEEIYNDAELKVKIDGMCYRNNISKNTFIAEDVLAEVVIQLMKYDTIKLIEAYCDSYRRVFALAVTIATRSGFAKMNTFIHPNASVAKSILFGSNLNKTSYLCNTTEKIIDKENQYDLPIINDDKLWIEIRSHLTQEEEDFLDFILEKVMNKKYKQAYSRDLRQNYYSFNEYKIRRLELQNKIKEIIKNIL